MCEDEKTCHMIAVHNWCDEWEPYGIYCSECEEFVIDWMSDKNIPLPDYCPRCKAKVIGLQD